MKNNSSNIIEITSTQNELVKFCVKLQNPSERKKEKLIFLDGDKTLSGLIDEGYEFEYIFLKKENYNPSIKSKNVVFCNDKVLDKISTLKTPTDIAGIIKEPEINQNIFFDFSKIALIDNIKDPGNLGTIIRSAAAFSIDGIILFGECVDIYNSKTIRATAQNMFKVPIIKADLSFIKELKKKFKIVATSLDSDKDFFRYKFNDKTILALGSEAKGLSEEIIKISDVKLKINMDNNVESINLGAFASVAFAYMKYGK